MQFIKQSYPKATFWLTSLIVAFMLAGLCYYSTLYLFKKTSGRLLQHISTPQWFATGIAISKMSEDGTLYQQLLAGEMRHFADSQTTQIQHINLKVYSDPESPWELTAKQGEALHSDKLEEVKFIDLKKDVLLKKAATAKQAASRMETDFLRIFPNTRKAKTDSRVDFSQPGHHLSAIGMDADFNKNIVILRKQVKSDHEPTKVP